MSLVRSLRACLLALALVVPPSAGAALFRAYLSSKGLDSNPCTVAAPCRLLPAALNAVADGGEVWILDSANYNTGSVTIAKSVTIVAIPSAVGSFVTVDYGSALSVNRAGAKVTLRNLSFGPLSASGVGTGLTFQAGASLTVERCVFARLLAVAIEVPAPATLRVLDSTFRDNGYAGIILGTGARATIHRSTFTNHPVSAIVVRAGVAGALSTVDVSDSVFSGNSDGVRAWSQVAGAPISGTVTGSTFTGGMVGVFLQSDYGSAITLVASGNVIQDADMGLGASGVGSVLYAAANTITGAMWGIYAHNGTTESSVDNALRNNVSDLAGTPTTIPRM